MNTTSYENPWIFNNEIFDSCHINKFYGFVYEIECIITGKKYIGRKYFSRKVGNKRKESDWKTYYGSSKELLKDILLLGCNNFKRTILTLHTTRGDVNYWETKLQFELDVLNSRDEYGCKIYYNGNILMRWKSPIESPSDADIKKLVDEFGDLKCVSDEVKNKISMALKGIPKKPFTDKHKMNISKSLQGRIAWNDGMTGLISPLVGIPKSEEHKEKIRKTNINKGIKPKNCKENKTEETKNKISESNKGKIPWNKGLSSENPAWNKGVSTGPMSDETKDKIKKSNLGKIRNDEHKENYSKAAQSRPTIECPWCGKVGGYPQMKRWHMDNCKHAS